MTQLSNRYLFYKHSEIYTAEKQFGCKSTRVRLAHCAEDLKNISSSIPL